MNKPLKYTISCIVKFAKKKISESLFLGGNILNFKKIENFHFFPKNLNR
jgi:hypothetical protein